jgi:hypothetical protein
MIGFSKVSHLIFEKRRRVLIITQSACFWEYKDMYVYRKSKQESSGIQATYIPSLGADAQTEHRSDGAWFLLCVYVTEERTSTVLLHAFYE